MDTFLDFVVTLLFFTFAYYHPIEALFVALIVVLLLTAFVLGYVLGRRSVALKIKYEVDKWRNEVIGASDNLKRGLGEIVRK